MFVAVTALATGRLKIDENERGLSFTSFFVLEISLLLASSFNSLCPSVVSLLLQV